MDRGRSPDRTTEVRGRSSTQRSRSGSTASSASTVSPHWPQPPLRKRALPTSSATGAGPAESDELAQFVGSLPAERLVDLVIEQAEIDHQFRTRLSAWLSSRTPVLRPRKARPVASLDLRATKKEITAAYGRGFVSSQEAGDRAAGVFEAIEWISDINDAGHFRTAALLAQHAHKRAESAMNRVDDSGGEITDISDRLAELHAAACAEGAFPPEDLARRLIKLELDAELDTFHRSAISHRQSLGPEGLVVYGRLAQEACDALPSNADPYGRAFRVPPSPGSPTPSPPTTPTGSSRS